MSDLQRTVDTAKPILAYHPTTPVHYEKALREICRAPLEGGPTSELYAFFAKQLAAGVSNGQIRTSAGESIEEVAARMTGHYATCRERHTGKTILWVSHGLATSAFLCTVLDLSYDRPIMMDYIMDNGGVAIVSSHGSGKPTLDLFNCQKHNEDSRKDSPIKPTA